MVDKGNVVPDFRQAGGLLEVVDKGNVVPDFRQVGGLLKVVDMASEACISRKAFTDTDFVSLICHLKTFTGAFERLAALSSCALSDRLKLSPRTVSLLKAN